MNSKMGAALALIGVLFLVAGRADAIAAHYTDGTTFDGTTNFGPPPLAPSFSTPCADAVVDPSSLVFVTLHFVYGTTMPPSIVPVHDDTSDVVNYVGSAPGTFIVDVSSFVAGKAGFLAYTWNIGTGVTAWVPFFCTPPQSTTTTSVVVSGTTVQPPSTTASTIAAAGSTTTPATTETISPAGAQLPFTGGYTGPLACAAVVLVAAGALLARRKSGQRE